MDHRRSLKSRDWDRKRFRWPTAGALLMLGVGGWFASQSGGAPPEKHRAPAPIPIAAAPSPPAIVSPPAAPAMHLTRPLVETDKAASAESHDVIAGPRNENLVAGAKPHPITPGHLYLYHEVDLVESTWSALEKKDFVRARELIEEHRAAYAGRNDDLDEGMSLLADCMQYPSEATRARAQRFYDEETYSSARRRIRRWCLDAREGS